MQKKVTEFHKHKIYQGKGKDKRYITSVPDVTKPRGTREIRANTLTEMYKKLYEIYDITEEKHMQFSELYTAWCNYKRQFIEKNKKSIAESTVTRYQTDYNKFFVGTPLPNVDINTVSTIELMNILIEIFQSNELQEQCLKNLLGYVQNAFDYAELYDLIEKNPARKLDTDILKSFAVASQRDETKRFLDFGEIEALVKAVKLHEQNHPGYILDYVIEMALLTGMRVGELAALRWDCIDDNYFYINYSEHCNRYTDKQRDLYIGEPKNNKHRRYPLTPELKKLLERIKQLGYGGEWVFTNENGERSIADNMTSAARRRGEEAGLEQVSIHRIRRTVSSILNEKTGRQAVSSMLGHSEEVNEKHYDGNVHTDNEKIDALNALSVIVGI